VNVDAGANRLAHAATEIAVDWGLTLAQPFRHSCHAFVAPTTEGTVLKLTAPEDDEADHEAAALEFWGGDGAVRLVRRDPGSRAMLLERARPGFDISRLPEEAATAIAVEVATRLWQRAGEPFRWIGDHVPRWLDNAEAAAGAAAELIPLAGELCASLEIGRSVLIHGDLHHHNILDAGDRYLAIDPKPMLGEPEFDVPPFLWNPVDEGQVISRERTERRLAAFAAAGLDDERMRAWSVIRGAYLGVDGPDVEVLRELL
jgi:streptomycin 6-kinase